MADEVITNTLRVLTFTLGEEFFAIDIYTVREILDMTEITKIPQMPGFMRGVVNVRGTAVPVIDMRNKFGLGAIETTINTRIIIVEIKRDDDIMVLGAMADSVKEVLELDEDAIDPPPRMSNNIRSDFLRGIGKQDDKFILVLDIARAFSNEELEVVGGVGSGMGAGNRAGSESEVSLGFSLDVSPEEDRDEATEDGFVQAL